MEKRISEIINSLTNYEGISFVDKDEQENGVELAFSINYLDTLTFTEDIYNKWEDMLDSIDIKTDSFEIYMSYDKSGFDYWSNRMGESNYTFMYIFIMPKFNDNDFNWLFLSIDNIIYKIDSFLNERE